MLNKIKDLKKIKPADGFVKQSLEIILSINQDKKSLLGHLLEGFRYSLALSLGTIMLVVALGGFSYLRLNGLSPVLVGSLNTKGLLTEAETTNFSIRLAEAKYFDDSSSAATVALNAISSDNPDHLNDEVLEMELKNLENKNPSSQQLKDIDDAVL